MGFTEAVRSVVVEHYAGFRGRAPRSEFWWFILFYYALLMVVGAIGSLSDTLGTILSGIVFPGAADPEPGGLDQAGCTTPTGPAGGS